LRKVAVALLAAPVVALIYLQLGLRRSVAARLGLVIGVGALLGLAGLGAFRPSETTASEPGDTVAKLPTAEFRTTLRTGQGLAEPVVLSFSRPMDRAAVAAALEVDPPASVELDWAADGSVLTVSPRTAWAPGTYYVVTVGSAATDAQGAALASPARAAFLTRPATPARLGAAPIADGRLITAGSFTVTVDGEVDPGALAASLAIEPPVEGHVAVVRVAEASEPGARPSWQATFVPASSLPADTTYSVRLLDGLVDAEGAPVAAPEPLVIQTVDAPGVVRFRPYGAATGVPVDQVVSVRFSEPMDRASTERAFLVTADGQPVKGTLHWSEGDTVLALDPAADFAKGARIRVVIAPTARSASGAPMVAERHVGFTIVEPPPPPRPSSTPKPPTGGGSSGGGSGGSTGGGGSSAGSSSWADAERLVVTLMNCTRGGGWVEADGSCSSPGGGSLKALKWDQGIADRVARPYARKLVAAGVCSHTYGSGLLQRFRAGGFTGAYTAENLGCRYFSSARAAAISLVRFFQSEKSWNGGHWRNMMTSVHDRVGVGFWSGSGRVRIVVDFYKTP
jgi:hypothetical protein